MNKILLLASTLMVSAPMLSAYEVGFEVSESEQQILGEEKLNTFYPAVGGYVSMDYPISDQVYLEGKASATFFNDQAGDAVDLDSIFDADDAELLNSIDSEMASEFQAMKDHYPALFANRKFSGTFGVNAGYKMNDKISVFAGPFISSTQYHKAYIGYGAEAGFKSLIGDSGIGYAISGRYQSGQNSDQFETANEEVLKMDDQTVATPAMRSIGVSVYKVMGPSSNN